MPITKNYITQMDPVDQKLILEELCNELKSEDPENFEYAQVGKGIEDDKYYLDSDARDYPPNTLLFSMSDKFNLQLSGEFFKDDGEFIGANIEYTLGEPKVETIMMVHNIFCDEGRVKYGNNGDSLDKLLDDHKKYYNTKSAKN